MEFVTESSGVRGRSGPRGACYGEWSGVCCRDLSKSGGAAWNPLQRVEQDGCSCRDLSENLNPSTEARLGCLMKQNGSLHRRSRGGSDVLRSLMNLPLSDTSDADVSGGSHLL